MVLSAEVEEHIGKFIVELRNKVYLSVVENMSPNDPEFDKELDRALEEAIESTHTALDEEV